MTTFQEAREFLLRHRMDYDRAVADFRWPDVNEIKEEQKKWLKEEDLLFIHVDIATVIFIQMIVIYSV